MTVDALPRDSRARETSRPMTDRQRPSAGEGDAAAAAEREPPCLVSPSAQSWPRVFPGL